MAIIPLNVLVVRNPVCFYPIGCRIVCELLFQLDTIRQSRIVDLAKVISIKIHLCLDLEIILLVIFQYVGVSAYFDHFCKCTFIILRFQIINKRFILFVFFKFAVIAASSKGETQDCCQKQRK